MALNKVEICGVNTSKLPVLTAEEKAELFRRIKNGDEQARELYIKGAWFCTFSSYAQILNIFNILYIFISYFYTISRMQAKKSPRLTIS